MENSMDVAGIAAGHPATAEAGVAILRQGGNAADAAVAAVLASCVAETVMTGIAGGGHAIWWDAGAQEARLLDFFVAVPGLGDPRAPSTLVELEIGFGEQVVPYTVGIATCAVPGVPAGLDALWRRYGTLPWHILCEPALNLARKGVEMPAAHATCLAMLEPVFRLREGARIYAPGNDLLQAGDRLEQPGLVQAFELVAAEGAATFYRGTIAQELLALMDERGGLITGADLDAYEARWEDPIESELAGVRLSTRGDLAGIAGTARRLPRLRTLDPPARALALVRVLAAADRLGHTTNLTVVDAGGNGCVVTTSLGLGSGDWLPGLDLHLNSMLGETELVVDRLVPGERMHSMMAPTVAFDDAGLVLAAGSAGGSRLRSALIQVLAGVLDEGLHPIAAVERPRLHPSGSLVHVEPGFDDDVLEALEASGYEVRRWPSPHHYFGGTSVVGRAGAAADPRRDGLALTLEG